MTKKKKKLIILLVVLTLGGWWFYNHYYTGSRSGKVVDAATGQPIEGAVVCMQWCTGGFMTVVGGSGSAFYETKTDEKGRYRIPSLHVSRPLFFERVHDENVLIYKDEYSAYEVSGTDYKPVGRSFASGTENQPYRKKRNLVRLYRFRKSDSHRKHFDWIRTFGIYDWPEQLLEKELQKEMERERNEK